MPSTLAIGLELQPTTTPPSVRVTVTETGTPSVGSVVVQRIDPDGGTRPVRTPDGGALVVSGGIAGPVTDSELPYGAPVTYTVAANNNPTASVTLAADAVWLTHPGVPFRSMPVLVQDIGDIDRDPERSLLQPIGRARGVAITAGVRNGESGQLSVLTQTDVEAAAMRALLDDSSVLLLNQSPGRALGLRYRWISVGKYTEKRVNRLATDPLRIFVLPFDDVDRPGGGTRAQITWADIAAKYATWADIPAGTTWAQLAAGA